MINKESQLLKLIWSCSFIVWFITEYTIAHSIVAQTALASFGAISILMIVISRKFSVTSIYIFYCLFIFICYVNIDFGFSIVPSASKELLSTLIKNLLFLISVHQYISIYSLENFKKYFIFSTTIASVFLLIITLATTGSFFLRGENNLINANSLAVSNAYAICLIIYSPQKFKISSILSITILTIFCVLSGTRKALIAVILGIIIYFCLKYPQKLIRNIITISVLIMMLYIIIMKIPFLYNMIGHRIESLYALIRGEDGDASAKTRYYFIQLGMAYFKMSPIIGHGINCFKMLPLSFGTYSHNNYIELLFSVGIVGTLSYYLMYSSLLIRSLKLYFKTRTNDIIIAITFIIISLAMDLAMVSYYARSSLIFIVMCYNFVQKEKYADVKNNRFTT